MSKEDILFIVDPVDIDEAKEKWPERYLNEVSIIIRVFELLLNVGDDAYVLVIFVMNLYLHFCIDIVRHL